MAVLKNPKHELFAQALAKGTSQADAYIQAGYKPSRSAAARLFADVNIRGRLTELGERVAAKTEITAAQIAERLMRIADVAEGTGVEVNADGRPLKSSSKHLGVARAALMDIAKLNGLVIDKAETTATGAMTVQYVTTPGVPAPAPGPEDYETGE